MIGMWSVILLGAAVVVVVVAEVGILPAVLVGLVAGLVGSSLDGRRKDAG